MIVEDKFYVGYRDVDTNLKIKNSAILNFFEDIAEATTPDPSFWRNRDVPPL